MGKKSTPPPPDYKAAAEATGASSQDAQTRADWANRPTVNTPWGTESWAASSAIDPSTGKPITQWTQNTQLNPLAADTLNNQMTVDRDKAALAQGQIGRAQAAMSSPFDWENLQAMGGTPKAGGMMGGLGIQGSLDTGSLGAMPQADSQERQRIENAMFERMAPQHQQAQSQLEGKLANMGLTRGSEAWNREMQRMGDQQSRERFNALEAGGNEMQRQFGMQMQGRQQGWGELQGAGEFRNAAQGQGFGQQMAAGAQNYGQEMQSASYQNQLRQQQIAEQMQRRSMPLNELNALLSGTQVGQLQTPDFAKSQSAGGVDYSGAAGQQYGASMDAYNAKQQQRQSMMSGLTSMAGTGMMAMAF